MSATVISSGGTVYSFLMWEGQIRPKQNVGEVFSRLGQTGSGVQTLGLQAPPSPIHAHYLTTTLADAAAFRAGVMLLKYLYVNVNEPDGAAWVGALVRDVIATKKNGFFNYGGFSYPIAVMVDFVFEAQ